ncbi:MAG: MotA/TolQ/ExbB proton channel family protein [Gammaproteobacteria bacterium]|nr:MotA/TolQ/ExbB proton channel family protein [Gammaproteobacteria bacterium]
MMAQIEAIRALMDAGGFVLWVIFFVSMLLWFLLIERFLFFRFALSGRRQQWLSKWNERNDKISWRARKMRQKLMSEATLELSSSASVIRVLIAIAPLLGLLGTVTGMVTIFDVMAIEGSGNARAMASGVSRATLPTMAGMVVAIIGLFLEKRYTNQLKDELLTLSRQMHLKVEQ